jgi:hypothetical protein
VKDNYPRVLTGDVPYIGVEFRIVSNVEYRHVRAVEFSPRNLIHTIALSAKLIGNGEIPFSLGRPHRYICKRANIGQQFAGVTCDIRLQRGQRREPIKLQRYKLISPICSGLERRP